MYSIFFYELIYFRFFPSPAFPFGYLHRKYEYVLLSFFIANLSVRLENSHYSPERERGKGGTNRVGVSFIWKRV